MLVLCPRTKKWHPETQNGGYIMNNIKLLLSQFAELYEKQDMLNKLTSKDFINLTLSS